MRGFYRPFVKCSNKVLRFMFTFSFIYPYVFLKREHPLRRQRDFDETGPGPLPRHQWFEVNPEERHVDNCVTIEHEIEVFSVWKGDSYSLSMKE